MTVSEPSQVQGEVGHTPGPFRVARTYVVDEKSRTIAACDVSPRIPWNEKVGNARLFAAAPELRTLLNELRNRCEGEINDGELLDRVDALLSSTRKDERA